MVPTRHTYSSYSQSTVNKDMSAPKAYLEDRAPLKERHCESEINLQYNHDIKCLEGRGKHTLAFAQHL